MVKRVQNSVIMISHQPYSNRPNLTHRSSNFSFSWTHSDSHSLLCACLPNKATWCSIVSDLHVRSMFIHMYINVSEQQLTTTPSDESFKKCISKLIRVYQHSKGEREGDIERDRLPIAQARHSTLSEAHNSYVDTGPAYTCSFKCKI